jgi:CDGSH-type Zn-finger protein
MSDSPLATNLCPRLVELEAGKTYAYCQCGHSRNQPFCDGAHKAHGGEPLIFKAERTEAVNLCCCKATNDAPYCDGSHNVL